MDWSAAAMDNVSLTRCPSISPSYRQTTPNQDISTPFHSNTIHPSFKRRSHKANISPHTTLNPNKQRELPPWHKKAVGANLQPQDANHTQTHAPVYTLKSKPKLNQCKRFVLNRPTEPTHRTH